MKLEPIDLNSITPNDLRWLAIFCENCYENADPEVLIRGAYVGSVVLWRAGNGIVVTTQVDRHGEREVFLNGFAGEGLIPYAKEIMEQLRDYARKNRAKRVVGLVHSDVLYKLYERIGARDVARYYAVEA